MGVVVSLLLVVVVQFPGCCAEVVGWQGFATKSGSPEAQTTVVSFLDVFGARRFAETGCGCFRRRNNCCESLLCRWRIAGEGLHLERLQLAGAFDEERQRRFGGRQQSGKILAGFERVIVQ